MRKIMEALLSTTIFAIIMFPSLVSAGSMTMTVSDGTGDLNKGWNTKTGELDMFWPESTPLVKAGYFDIVSASLAQKGSTFTFKMEVAAPLPAEGSALADGIHTGEWSMWIDPEPWNYALNPVPPLYRISLVYDGSVYSAVIVDCTAVEIVPLSTFSVRGSEIQLVFSAGSIDNFAFSWWVPMTRAYWGPTWSIGWFFVDQINWGSTEGQVWSDLPWPPP